MDRLVIAPFISVFVAVCGQKCASCKKLTSALEPENFLLFCMVIFFCPFAPNEKSKVILAALGSDQAHHLGFHGQSGHFQMSNIWEGASVFCGLCLSEKNNCMSAARGDRTESLKKYHCKTSHKFYICVSEFVWGKMSINNRFCSSWCELCREGEPLITHPEIARSLGN